MPAGPGGLAFRCDGVVAAIVVTGYDYEVGNDGKTEVGGVGPDMRESVVNSTRRMYEAHTTIAPLSEDM